MAQTLLQRGVLLTWQRKACPSDAASRSGFCSLSGLWLVFLYRIPSQGIWFVQHALSERPCIYPSHQARGGDARHSLFGHQLHRHQHPINLKGGVDGTISGVFALCLAEPPSYSPGAALTDAVFTYHEHVTAVVTHEPPSLPPSPPQPSSPSTPAFPWPLSPAPQLRWPCALQH